MANKETTHTADSLLDVERTWRDRLAYAGRFLWRDRSGVVGLVLFLVVVFAAVFAPWISPRDPFEQNLGYSKASPGQVYDATLVRQALIQNFGESELRALSSDMDVDYEELPTFSDDVSEKARALVNQLENEGRVSELVKRGKVLRSDLSWPEPERFLMGTDSLGYDIFSRVLYGARVSLTVGLFGVLIAGSLGLVIGAIAGYMGGRIDSAIMGIINLILSLPYLLFVVFIASVLGRSLLNVILIFGITDSPIFARVARGEVLRIRESGYVESAVSAGARWPRIIFDHILPNLIGPLITLATFEMSAMIFYEAGLGFLGLSVDPTETVSWGNMLANGMDSVMTGSPWIAAFPGLAIMFTSLGMNLLGDWLRDVLDPRLRRSRK